MRVDISWFKAQIKASNIRGLSRRPGRSDNDSVIEGVIFDVANMDIPGDADLRLLNAVSTYYKQKRVAIAVSNASESFLDTLRKSSAGFLLRVGSSNFFPSTEEAIQHLASLLQVQLDISEHSMIV